MITDNIKQIIKKYDSKKIRIGVLGSHSALEIASGAKQEGLETVVVCQKGQRQNLHQILPKHLRPCSHAGQILRNNKRSLRQGTHRLKHGFRSQPLLLSLRRLRRNRKPVRRASDGKPLDASNRRTQHPEKPTVPAAESGDSDAENLQVTQRNRPISHRESPEKQRAIERAFFYPSNPVEFDKMASDRIAKGIITQEALDHALMEEYVIGAKFNANLFWSPLTDEIDLLGL